MGIFNQIVQFILSLSNLVFLHELVHYFFARLFNTRVEKFYLFFNPWFSLFKLKKGDTEYGIGWLPLGGYVKISGMIDESMGFFWVFIGVMLAVGAALGMAMIFNGVTVNVLQRTREIAIMRAVGMHRAGRTMILALENLLIAFMGTLAGLPAGRFVSQYLMDSMSTSVEDMFSFKLVIMPRTYWFAAVFAVVILLVSQLPAIRRAAGLSLATATKESSE